MISLLAGRYSSKTRHRQDLLFFHSLKMSYVIHMMEFSVWLHLVWSFLLPLITYYLTLDCNPLLSFCVLSRILSTDVIIWVLYYSHVKNKVFQGFSPEIWTLTGTSLHLDSFLFESFSCRFTVVLGIRQVASHWNILVYKWVNGKLSDFKVIRSYVLSPPPPYGSVGWRFWMFF